MNLSPRRTYSFCAIGGTVFLRLPLKLALGAPHGSWFSLRSESHPNVDDTEYGGAWESKREGRGRTGSTIRQDPEYMHDMTWYTTLKHIRVSVGGGGSPSPACLG